MRLRSSLSKTRLLEIFEIVDLGDIIVNVELETDGLKLLILRVVVVITDLLVEDLSQPFNILFVGNQFRFLFGLSLIHI